VAQPLWLWVRSSGGAGSTTGGKYKQYYRQDRPPDVYESKRRKFAEYR
jgi:hypothetical protein